jgi:RNA polymerase sigma-70 factor, ECF subfamily
MERTRKLRRRPKATRDVTRVGIDPDALEAFCREHVVSVERFIARRVRDPYRIADLTADVFLAVIDSADSFRPSRGEPVAWLFGIARNVVSADLRQSARELGANGRIPMGRILVEADDVARLHERIDAEGEARRLHAAMDGLSDGERAVLELIALDGLSAREAADALGISQVAARVRLHRARRLLQNRLRSPSIEVSEQEPEASS